MRFLVFLTTFLFCNIHANEDREMKAKINKMRHKSVKIVGLELKTTNENGRAFQEIPKFWHDFMKNNVLQKISNRVSDDLYGVYTNFVNTGENNNGVYSLIIGAAVSDFNQVEPGFITVEIPDADYATFGVENGNPQLVGKAWQDIWGLSTSNKSFDQSRTYFLEFEHYKAGGGIDIYLGVKD